MNSDKCVLGVESLTFLGNTISAQEVLPFQDRVLSIRNIQLPESQRQLRHFFGMITFYHLFISLAATLLTSLPKKQKRGQSILVTWTDTAHQAFQNANSAPEMLHSCVSIRVCPHSPSDRRL